MKTKIGLVALLVPLVSSAIVRGEGPKIEFQMPQRSEEHPYFTMTKAEFEFYKNNPAKRLGIFAKRADGLAHRYADTSKYVIVGRSADWHRYIAAYKLAMHYLLTGDWESANVAKQIILFYADETVKQGMMEITKSSLGKGRLFAGGGLLAPLTWNIACAYDLLYDQFTEPERSRVELYLSKVAHAYVQDHRERQALNPKGWHTVGNGYPATMAASLLAGLITQDSELVDTLLNEPEFGFRGWIDFLSKVQFWPEGIGYTRMTLSGLVLLTRIAQINLGVALLDYRIGDVDLSMMCRFYEPMEFPVGRMVPTLEDCTHGDLRRGASFYAYFLTHDPKRNQDLSNLITAKEDVISLASGYWVPPLGMARLLDTFETPPTRPLRTVHLPYAGVCILRSDEPPDKQKYLLFDYGREGSPREHCTRNGSGPHGFGGFNRRVKWYHEHHDDMQIVYFDNGMLLGPDPGYSYRWTSAHNTVVVDGREQKPVIGYMLPPDIRGRLLYLHAGKVIQMARGTNGGAYPGVMQDRTLVLANEYVLDVFNLKSAAQHTYDWLYHNYGEFEVELPMKAAPGSAGSYKGYSAITNQEKASTPADWEMVFSVGDQKVYLGMLGAEGTTVITGRGPGERPPLEKMPKDIKDIGVVLVRRKSMDTFFVALIESSDSPSSRIKSWGKIAEGVKIEGDTFVDFILLSSELTGDWKDIKLSHKGFSLSGQWKAPFGFLRVEKLTSQVLAEGNVRGIVLSL